MKTPSNNMICEVALRYKRGKKHTINKASNADDVYNFAKKIWPCDMETQESFVVLYLNNKNVVVNWSTLSIGGLTGTLVDVRVIMAIALKSLSVAVVLLHNHPSNETKPSRADIEITKKIVSAAKTLDITVLDHLIVTKWNGFRSMATEMDVAFNN